MSLTGIPLIVLAALCAAAALAGTVLIWRRWGRLRYVLRPAGILLVEALIMVTVGLAANRSQDFYPNWAALLDTANTGGSAYKTSAGSLDAWLTRRAGSRTDLAQTFTWTPDGWTSWRLFEPPTVTIPAGYLQNTAWRYSAVVVVGALGGDWQAVGQGRAAPVAGPAVVVYVTATRGTPSSALAVTLPDLLTHDLRVTAHRWALVSASTDDGLAVHTVGAARGRYPAVAFVGPAAAAPTPAPGVAPSRAATKAAVKPVVRTSKKAKPVVKVTKKPAPKKPAPKKPADKKPVAKTSAVKPPPAKSPLPVLPAGVADAYFPETRQAVSAELTAARTKAPDDPALQDAVAWAADQLPPPLAASAPQPAYVPIQKKKPHHGHTGTRTGSHTGRSRPHPSVSESGAVNGTRQPRP